MQPSALYYTQAFFGTGEARQKLRGEEARKSKPVAKAANRPKVSDAAK